MSDSLDFGSLVGWSVKDWSIRPKMLMTVNFVLRRSEVSSNGPFLAKLLFARPDRIKLSNFRPLPKLGLIVRDLIETNDRDNFILCRIDFEEAGELTVRAWKKALIFW
jgi:hypothetical protein